MKPLQRMVRRRPRLAAALAFGGSTALLTHFAWYPQARLSGMIPALTLAAGLAHALGGAITGRRLVDGSRTRNGLHAVVLGAVTSLIALAVFAPAMAAYVSAGPSRTGPFGYVVLTLLTGLFAFLGAGWALLLLSAAVGFGLYRLARVSSAASPALAPDGADGAPR